MILMMCLVGIDIKILEKTSFHFFSFWRFPPLFRSHGSIRWKTNVIFVMSMLCLVGIDIKILEKTIFNFHYFWRFPLLSRSRGAIRLKTNVIFVIPMMCLVGIDIKIIKILIFFARTPTRTLFSATPLTTRKLAWSLA